MIFESGGVWPGSPLWAAGVEVALAAGLAGIAASLAEAARRSSLRERRRGFAISATLFGVTAVATIAAAGVDAESAAVRAAAIGAASLLFLAAAVQLRGLLLTLAASPTISALESALTQLEDELARRKKFESDLGRKGDELRASNASLKEAATALRASEDRLAIALDAGRVGLWDWNLTTGETWCSARWFEILGQSAMPADQGRKAWRAAVSAAEETRLLAALEAHLREGAEFHLGFCIKTPAGEERWVEASGRALRDGSGAPTRMAGAMIDVTEAKRAQEALIRTEAFERAVLETVGDGIVACDESGRLVLFNHVARAFHGVDAEPIAAPDWAARYDLFEPDGRTPLTLERVPLARALAGETVAGQEMVIAPRDLPRRLVEVHAAPLVDRSGRRIGAVAAMRDVTRERAAISELARKTSELELVFNHVPVELWHLTAAGAVRRANSHAAAALGLDVASIEGAQLADLPPPAARLFGARTAAPNDAQDSIEEHRGPDGAARWLKVHRVPYRDDATGEELLFAAATDITQTMLAKMELCRSNEELEQFARAAAHDLREPLRKILCFSDFLARDLGDGLPATARADLDIIVAAARRMESLIHGILSMARIEAGAPDLAPTDPRACIDAALSQLQLPPERAVRFAFDPMPPVLADRDLLVQVFQNLIGNAVKFARPGGGVEIAFTSASEAEGDAIIGVADNGIGVPEADRRAIFEPLTRLHPREAYEGTGIGLALCKKSIDRLGGEIWMEPSASGGAHFRVRLRRAA